MIHNYVTCSKNKALFHTSLKSNSQYSNMSVFVSGFHSLMWLKAYDNILFNMKFIKYLDFGFLEYNFIDHWTFSLIVAVFTHSHSFSTGVIFRNLPRLLLFFKGCSFKYVVNIGIERIKLSYNAIAWINWL